MGLMTLSCDLIFLGRSRKTLRSLHLFSVYLMRYNIKIVYIISSLSTILTASRKFASLISHTLSTPSAPTPKKFRRTRAMSFTGCAKITGTISLGLLTVLHTSFKPSLTLRRAPSRQLRSLLSPLLQPSPPKQMQTNPFSSSAKESTSSRPSVEQSPSLVSP